MALKLQAKGNTAPNLAGEIDPPAIGDLTFTISIRW